jgi:hypothetical protein
MNAQVKSIGRMAALQQAADRNGWEIVHIEANRTDAIVLFDRGRSPFGPDKTFGTSEFYFAAGYFGQGHYDLSFDEARVDFRNRCNRTFPA